LSAAGHTVIIVTHDPRTVREFCNRALLLERGRVAMDEGSQQVAAAYLELLGRDRPDSDPSAGHR
jgi:ABC-type polysaccharide/polyol phosphate transport system ATPase subunit